MQSILRLEKAINDDEPLEAENDLDIMNDLAMTLTFNEYATGRARKGEELVRDKETGHITRFYKDHIGRINKSIETIKKLNELKDKIGFKEDIDYTDLIELRERNIDREPLFDNPFSRISTY